MKSGGYYSNSYGKSKAYSADEADNSLYYNSRPLYTDSHGGMLNNYLDSNEEEEYYDDHVFSNQTRNNNFNDYDDDYETMKRTRNYPEESNGMHMKFDIVHKDPIYDTNHIYRLKQNDTLRQKGNYNDFNNNNRENDTLRHKGNYNDFNNNNRENDTLRHKGNYNDFNNDYRENYDGRSGTFNLDNFDQTNRTPGYQIVAVLLNSYPLSTEEVDNANSLEAALNKYIKVGQKQIKDRKEMLKPKKNDVAFWMNFYPECLALLDFQSKKIVRKHPIIQIMIYGYSTKKSDPLFAYIHREKENATCWLYHTFANANAVSQAFQKICMEGKEKTLVTNKSMEKNVGYANNVLSVKNPKNVRNSSYVDKEFKRSSNPVDNRYMNDDEYSRNYISHSKPQTISKYNSNEALYRRPPQEGSRQSRQVIRSFDDDFNRSKRSISYEQNYSPDFSPPYARIYGSPHNKPKNTSSFQAERNQAKVFQKPRFKPIYEGEVYSTRGNVIPAITYDSPKHQRENSYQTYTNSRTLISNGGTIDRRNNDQYQIKLFNNEVILCKYVGFLNVNKMTGSVSANRIAEKLITLVPQHKWLNVNVDINPSMLRVERTSKNQIFAAKMINLNYIGSFNRDKRFAIVSSLLLNGGSTCLVFYCEPSCQILLKTLNSAYNQQKEVTTYSQKYINFP